MLKSPHPSSTRHTHKYPAGGPDPQVNPRLAALIAAANKAGFPKVSVENAIARGQGVSLSGAALEAVTIEAMLPPSVALIIECQTDSRLRTLGDIRVMIKDAGGTVTPTNHLFEKKGKIVLKNSRELKEEDLFDQAIEAGATDIRMGDDGNIEVFTEANQTMAVAKDLSGALDLEVQSSDVVWDPKEDTMVDMENADILNNFIGMSHSRSQGTAD